MTAMSRWPLSFLILAVLGGVCLLAALAMLTGLFGGVHPLIGDGVAAGLALLVSAIALLLSAGFPLVLRRLATQDAQAAATENAHVR